MTVVTWPRKPSRTRSTTVPQCKTTCSVHLVAQDSALSRHSHRFESGTEYQGFYSQASIRYRGRTLSLCGPNRPGTGPNITASAVERKHRTPKLAFSVLDYKNLVSKCSWTHTSLSRSKKGIVTP